MKLILFFASLIFGFYSVFSQSNIQFGVNIKMDTIVLRHYDVPKEKGRKIKTLVIHSAFDAASLIDANEKLKILDAGLTQIISVDYVFTQQKDRKSQEDLNKRRLLELYLQAPNVVTQSMTKWRFIEQLGFLNEADAKKLFHGFVVKYKTVAPYKTTSIASLREDITDISISPVDSTAIKVFTRNPAFSKDLVVADFTGSMSPYFKEVMAWFYLHEFKRDVPFVFFNDGDATSDGSKIIGKTGGLYPFHTNNLDTLVKYAYETIRHGNGGDCPENDIEAILKGIELYPKCKEVILIADNWSDIRDYGLRFKVDRPVRVILCGTDMGINVQYLNLARITKGSVHTMNQDLENLYQLTEGQTFSLAGNKYIIRSGKIEALIPKG